MIGIDVERDREMKKWETIGLDRVIQMTREKAEWWRREGEETGGDGLPCPPLPPLQSRTMRHFPNLSPEDEGSLWRPLSSTWKLSESLTLPLSLLTSSVRSHLYEM